MHPMHVHMRAHVHLQCRPDQTRPDPTRPFLSSNLRHPKICLYETKYRTRAGELGETPIDALIPGRRSALPSTDTQETK